MRTCAVAVPVAFCAVLLGCGGSEDPPPEVSDAAARADRPHIVFQRDGGGEAQTDAAFQRDGGGEVQTDAAALPNGCRVSQAASGLVEDTCKGEFICDCAGLCPAGTCVAALPRWYELRLHQVRVPERRPDGDCWDVACGAPDPFVVIVVDGTEVGRAPAVQDAFAGQWAPYSIRAQIAAGSLIEFHVYDEDLSSSDGAFAIELNASPAALRNRLITYAADAHELVAEIEPVI